VNSIPLLTLLFIFLGAFTAGALDAIVGGGGLIQLPVLMIGLKETPIASVLGTNKLSAIFGTSSAAITYARRTKLDLRMALTMALWAGVGSAIGAGIATLIPVAIYKPIILFFLIMVGIYTVKNPNLGLKEIHRHSRSRLIALGSIIALVIGFYDGAVGPGTGSFLVFALVGLLGYEFLRASAIAKVVNVATNFAAIVVFGFNAHIIFALGLCMAAFNVMGALVGSRLAIKGGSKLVRRFFLVVVALLIVRLTWDIFQIQ